MKPSVLSIKLKEIANKIDRSKKPNRVAVANDLKKLISSIASTHQSGNPESESGYGVKAEVLAHNGVDKGVVSIEGFMYGKPINGKMTIHVLDGVQDGYEWEPKSGLGLVDPLESDDGSILDKILEICSDELGLFDYPVYG